MTYETCARVYEAIHRSSLEDVRAALYKSAVRYARIRADWYLAHREQRLEMDATRSRAHDAFIDACNILSRNMAKAGEDNGWRALLGEDRKEIGDFACHLHALFGIRAR